MPRKTRATKKKATRAKTGGGRKRTIRKACGLVLPGAMTRRAYGLVLPGQNLPYLSM